MKKITFVVLAAVSAIGTAFGQANISALAPSFVGRSGGRLPSGIMPVKHLRSCFLIKKSELGALTGSIVNSISLPYTDGSGATTSSGNFTLYLENTSDNTYQKGTNFATAIANMTVSYNGMLNVPTGTAGFTVNLPTTPTFTYSGNSIYVALEWDETTPAANTNTNSAAHYASNAGTGNGLCAIGITSVSPAVTTLTVSDIRPCLLFNAVNTATNEVDLVSMTAPGKISKQDPTPQTIEVVVVNRSIGTLNNIPVNFGVVGANAFTNVQTIPSLPAGGQTTVTFPGYSPTVNGTSQMVITIPSDENMDNNLVSWAQELSCDKISPTLPYTNPVTAYGNALSSLYPAGTAYAFKYTTGTVASSLTGVNNFVISLNLAANSGKQLYASLFDANGALVANGKTITIGSSQLDVVYNYPFDAPVALTPNTTYYIGITVPATGYYPVGLTGAISKRNLFYVLPLGGGAPLQLSGEVFGYFSLDATLGYSNTIISASATRTTVCNKSNETTTLLANGSPGLTYTWTPGASSGSSVVVTPSLSAASGAINYAVVAKDPVSGCTSNKAVVTVSLANCTGFDNNGDFGTSIAVFPNPSVNGKTYIKGLDGSSKVDVFNVLGQVVLTLNPGESEVELDLSSQPAGSYLVKITSDSNKSRTMKILNQN